MRLNHVNLVVGDLDGAQDFFRRLFGFELLDRRRLILRSSRCVVLLSGVYSYSVSSSFRSFLK